MRLGIYLSLGSLLLLAFAACSSDSSSDDPTGAAGAAGSGGSAGAAGSTFDPTPVELAGPLPYPFDLAVDSTHIYFSCAGTSDPVTGLSGMLARVAKGSATVEPLIENTMAVGLAMDGSNLYVTTKSDAGFGVDMYVKASGQHSRGSFEAPGVPMLLAPHVASAAQTASQVYFLNMSHIMSFTPATSEVKEVRPFVSQFLAGLGSNGAVLVWGEDGMDNAIEPNGQGKLYSYNPALNQEPKLLFDISGTPVDVAVDATDAYVTDMNLGIVWKVSLDGTKQTKLASDQTAPNMIVVDDSFVYWTNRGPRNWQTGSVCGSTGSVMKVAKTGGSPTVIASEVACPSGIAVDDKYVYWVSSGTQPDSGQGDGSIWRAGK